MLACTHASTRTRHIHTYLCISVLIHTRLHTYPHILTHTHIHPCHVYPCQPFPSNPPVHHITSHHITSHHITLRDNALVTYMELKETSGIKVCWVSWVFELRYLELLLWLAHVGPSTGALGSRDGLPLGKMSAPASEGMPCWQWSPALVLQSWNAMWGMGIAKPYLKKQFFPHPKISHKPWVGDSKTWPRPQGASHNTVAVPASAHHSWAGTAPSAAPSLKGWKMKENNNKKRKPWQYHAINLWISMDFLHHFTVFQIPCWSMLNLG